MDLLLESRSLENRLKRNMFGRIRGLGRQLPVLKRAFLPLWEPFTHACWVLRNVFTNRRPIRVLAGDEVVLLHPEGQIAEVLWVADFEAAERDLVARVAMPRMRVVNIGANIGLYAIITGKLIGPEGQVHAFEPSTTTYKRLERNTQLNKLANVFTNNIALSDMKGRLILRSDPKNRSLDGHRFVESLSQSGTVKSGDEVIPCDTLDSYFSHLVDGEPLPAIDLIIMDVEGAEWMVLKGGLQILRASPAAFLVLECSQNRKEVGDLLAREDFRFYTWDPTVPRLVPVDFVAGAARGMVIAYRGDPEEYFSAPPIAKRISS
jgi:FkbM family methyltransferase